MVFLNRRTGACIDRVAAPGSGWVEVPGHGALFRRREAGIWRAAHAWPPDAPLWHARGWERVRFRAAEPVVAIATGRRSGLNLGLAPDRHSPAAAAEGLWIVLPDEVGWDTPAPRPGAQARFEADEARSGLPPEELVARLFPARVLALGIDVERARWALRGPLVSPEDLRLRRRLRPLLELAERLAEDVAEAAAALAARPPAPFAARRAGEKRPRPGPPRRRRPRAAGPG